MRKNAESHPLFHSRERGNLACVSMHLRKRANIGAPHKCGEIPAFAGMEKEIVIGTELI